MPTPPKKKPAPPAAASNLAPVSESRPLLAHETIRPYDSFDSAPYAVPLPTYYSGDRARDYPSNFSSENNRPARAQPPIISEYGNVARDNIKPAPAPFRTPASPFNAYEETTTANGKPVPTPSRTAASQQFKNASRLRPARKPMDMRINDGLELVTIKKAWLQGLDITTYRKAIKQVLSVASAQVALEDLRARKASSSQLMSLKQKLDQLMTGRWPIEVRMDAKIVQSRSADKMMASSVSEAERFTLIKYGARTKLKKERHFSFIGGQLVVYATKEKGSYPRHYYGLVGAQYSLEERSAMRQIPPFEANYNFRIRIACRERQAGPLLLYADSEKQAQGWMRVIKFARYTVSQDSRTALQICIRRLLSKSRQKGYDALARYVQELLTTKSLVWQLAMRLIRADQSRAWTKCRAVYHKRLEMLKQRREKEVWAFQFLAEKMRRYHNAVQKPTSTVREDIVTRMQHLFRLFKNRSLAKQSYVLGSSAKTRPQQGKQGITLGIAFTSITGRDALGLMLDQGHLQLIHDSPQMLLTTKNTYTDFSLPPRVSHAHLSDCLSMLLFSDAVGASDVAGLSKADWSHFVHLNRISAIVLNSERVESPLSPFLQKGLQKVENVTDALKVPLIDKRLCDGVWFTLLGPRVCWGRQVQQPGDPKQNRSPAIVGVEDGIALGDALLRGVGTARFRVFISVKTLTFPGGQIAAKIAEAIPEQSRCVINLLGRTMSSETRGTQYSTQAQVNYSLSFEVVVPLSEDRGASLTTLDDHELCLDVVRAGGQEVIWRTRVKLWRLLAPGSPVGSQMLPVQAPLYSLSKSMLDGKIQIERRLAMTLPGAMELENTEGLAYMDLDVMTEILNPVAAGGPSPVVSPELKGIGPVTSLYSSHRGAWYDPHLGPKFQPDHVANFIEFTLGNLRFPHLDVPDPSKLYSYVVEVRCFGACASSPFLHRPRPNWSKVMDVGQIAFCGAKIVLPLPPGFWSGTKRPPQVQLVIYRRAADDFKTASYTELSALSKGAKPSPRVLEPVYHALLYFDGLTLNAPRPGIPVVVGSISQQPTHVAFSNGAVTGGSLNESAVLGMEVCLRDRDYVMLMDSSDVCSGEAPCPICVGDKAILSLEEQLVYPSSALDLRKTLSPAAWDERMIGKDWGMPLRVPHLVHELDKSGLRGLPEYENWRQKNIPRACSSRIAPHNYVLPPCERIFQNKHLPGVFWRVLDDIAANGVHVDGTCDLELSPSFISNWEHNPGMRFAIPGVLQLLRGSGLGTASQRMILRGVPVKYVSPAHAIGFNLYDATISDVDAAIKINPESRHCNFESTSPDGSANGLRCGGFSIAAGPLPVDANPAVCTYEWSLQVCAPSERDVFHFITMLRQCVRLGHQQKARQVKPARPPAAPPAALPATLPPDVVRDGMGQLEVVLVEARCLERKTPSPGADSLDAVLGGASATDQFGSLLAQPDLNVFVNFKMLSSIEGEVVSYKGVNVQSSLLIHGSESPAWHKQAGLTTSGGWTFRSPCFNPEKMSEMLLELDVRHQGITAEWQIGAIQLPVARDNFLTNPDVPFRDLWLPLTSGTIDGQRVLNSSGEVHIMTLWTNAADVGNGNNISARSYFLSEVSKKMAGGDFREPRYDLYANLSGFNPNNLGRHHYPRRRIEEMAVRMEGLQGAVSYIDCCEQRQLRAWHAIRQQLKEEGLQNARLGELRLLWQKQPEGEERILQLQTLLSQGVPGILRPMLWPQLTLSSRVQSQYPPNTYTVLLECGRHLQTPAYNQLDEDILLATDWEPSQNTFFCDLHHQRMEKARNVCIALITFSLNTSPDGGKVPNYRTSRIGTGVTYCESLLILAFYMLLPQGDIDKGRTKCLSEEMVFWMLYTLVATRINGAYKDYYATTGAIGSEMQSESRSICWKSGAMEDVFLLQCALVTHEPELWTRMAAIGFQLASVFYAAFMHLFVRMLPTASVFRLWDILFAESSNPNAFPHARHGLVDLAFAVLRSERGLLLQCQSALEMQNQVEAALASMFDPQAMTDLIEGACAVLWGGFSRNQLLKLFRDGTKEFEVHLGQYDQQNHLLKQLCHTVPRESREESKATPNPPHGHAAPISTASSIDPGMKTRDISTFVIPTFARIFPKEQTSNCGGILRPVPKWLLDFSPPVFESGVDKVLRFVGGAPNANAAALMGSQGPLQNDFAEPLPKMLIIPSPVGSMPEPQELKDATWVNEVSYNIPGWQRLAKPVFDAFVDPMLGRISLNEFLIGLICCSKGTAGEKASALFDLFASSKSLSLQAKAGLWPHSQHHRLATSKATNAVLQRLSHDATHSVAHGSPPSLDPRKDSALHFKIWTKNRQDTVLGEVVIRNLSPFTAGEWQDVGFMWFSIWSPPEINMPKLGAVNPKPRRVCIGEMEMALKWTPKDSRRAEVGQLWIYLRAIRFFLQQVPNPESKHPWVTVVTYDGSLAEKQIPVHKGAQQKLMSLSTGDHISFHAPSAFAKEFTSECGWHHASGEWRWNSVLGEQLSVASFAFTKDKVIDSASNAQALSIDIWAVRIIVQGVLARSLQYVTNRQAMLLADACFTRTGAVPGILDAVLVPGESNGEYPSVAALKEDYHKNGKEFVDVSLQLLLEAERQACQNVGCLSLWPALRPGSGCHSLKALKIVDPWPTQKKLLWLRYVRACSGERDNCLLLFTENGDIANRIEVRLDADGCDGSLDGFQAGHPETTLTKEEFVSCLLACPSLAEPLRRMSAEGHSVIRTPPLLLDVTLDSRAHVEEETDLMDMFFHARTGILLEVWMRGSIHNTYLGEAWMPPLESCMDMNRLQELPLQHIAEGPTESRPQHRSEKSYQEQYCGVLSIEAFYRRGDADQLNTRQGSDALPKGQLTLTISHADGILQKLLQPESRLEKAASHFHMPGAHHGDHHEHTLFVTGYAWNEKTRAWLHQGGKERCLFKTNACHVQWKEAVEMKGEVIWKEQFQIAFGDEEPTTEARKGVLHSMDSKMGHTTHLKVCFGSHAEWKHMISTMPREDLQAIGSELQEYSWDHQVEVFASDTIAMFLEKLAGASKEMGERVMTRIDRGIAKRYTDFAQDTKSKVLMVYAPSNDATKLQRPWNAAEFKQVYAEAMETFDHWEPLDPTCTFDQYASKFGFCNPPGTFPPLLRVEEASEKLRTSSHSYRRFLQERSLTKANIERLNNDRQAFAWAQYYHSRDGNSVEWRPCVARPDAPGKRTFKVSWAFSPSQEQIIDERTVLLAPSEPAILNALAPEHQQLLAEAQDLRASGMNDQQIASHLNSRLQQRSAQLSAPSPPITVGIVRSHLQRLQARQQAEAMQMQQGENKSKQPR